MTIKAYLFTKMPPPAVCRTVLERIARNTSTDDLVVALYRPPGGDWHAHAGVDWSERDTFNRAAGKWAFIRHYDIPHDLRHRFRIIRLLIGADIRYPCVVSDCYGWRLTFHDVEDHLAYLFAHELHHFRRHHLNLHPRQGEQAACRWALDRCSDTGFRVDACRLAPRRRARRHPPVRLPEESNPRLLDRLKRSAVKLSGEDLRDLSRWIRRRLDHAQPSRVHGKWYNHFDILRALPQGAPLLVTGDDARRQYLGQAVTKVRNLRIDSCRMAVLTPDGKTWHWPMQCLEPADDSAPTSDP